MSYEDPSLCVGLKLFFKSI